MEETGKPKKWISLVLFLLYLGSMLLVAQETPKTYIAFKTTEAVVVDGEAKETSWKNAPWSDFFIDIEGVKKPKYNTRMKMLWDDSNLYFFAELEEPHVWGNLKEKDTIIFYNNDFEIFIDPDGDTHDYYEYEMNVLNTVWDLYLSKPYRNAGKVLGDWDFVGLKSAVRVNGTLNNPSDVDTGWTLEIAIPWSFYTDPGRHTALPINDFWRISFSRVNWDFDLVEGKYFRKKDTKTGQYAHEYNWVWSPQGVINMHEPEKWGYVYFSDKSPGTKGIDFEIPKDDAIKRYLYDLYRELLPVWKNNAPIELNEGETRTIHGATIVPHLEKYSRGFMLSAKSPFTQKTLAIQTDGKFHSYEDE
ncbi:MAG: carbohydrate-binding family 9-like protein [Bacteroidota bacterium]